MFPQKSEVTGAIILVSLFIFPHPSLAFISTTEAPNFTQTKIINQLANQSIAVEQEDVADILSQTIQSVQSIDDAETKASILTNIAAAYAKVGQKEKASEILSQSLVLAHAIESDWEKSRALSKVAAVYQRIGQKEKAFEILFQEVERLGLSSELIEPVASICVATGQYDQILNLVGTIKPQKSAELLYVTVNKAAEAGQFQQALRLAQSTKDDEAKARALDILVGRYTRLGQYEQALKVIEVIKNTVAKAEILTTIASYYAVTGQKEKGSQLLSQALQIAQAVERDDKASLLIEIAIGYAAIGQYEQAKNVAQTIQTLFPPDIPSELMALTLAGIAAHYGADRQKEEAVKILTKALEFDKIASRQYRCPVKFVQPMLTEIATRYIAVGQYRQALQISEIFKDNHFKTKILNQIVSTYPESGQKVIREPKLALTVSDCGL